jgi:predicted nucleotidyltransferase
MSPGRKAQEFFSIRRELCQLLDVEVDLVMAGAVRNRIISREIEATKQLVYGA